MTSNGSLPRKLDADQLKALASSHGLEVNDKILSFLNAAVTAAAPKNAPRDRRPAARAIAELEDTYRAAEEETKAVRHELPEYVKVEIKRQVETGLPIITADVEGLPTLFVYIEKGYDLGREGRRLTFASRRVPGAARKRASGALESFCKKRRWEVTITDVLKVWVRAAPEPQSAGKLDVQNLKRAQSPLGRESPVIKRRKTGSPRVPLDLGKDGRSGGGMERSEVDSKGNHVDSEWPSPRLQSGGEIVEEIIRSGGGKNKLSNP